MQWPTIENITRRAPLPPGYRYRYLDAPDIPLLIAALKTWYPGIAVGNASCHLREDFYAQRVSLGGQTDRDFAVILFMHGGDLAGMFSAERDLDSEVLYGRICSVSPLHRGVHLSRNVLSLEEALGLEMHMGMVYGLATLNYPHMQASFERMGWQLIGITPGFDREVTAEGVVKRVYEALYAKVLVSEDDMQRPRVADMTPAVQALFDLLYPGRTAD